MVASGGAIFIWDGDARVVFPLPIRKATLPVLGNDQLLSLILYRSVSKEIRFLSHYCYP